MKRILTIMLFLTCHCLFSQDTIRLNSGEVLLSKVKTVKKGVVIYKSFNNLAARKEQVIKKSEIKSITYQNGTEEDFKKNKFFGEIPEDTSFYRLTKKGNNVFITSENANAIIHAKETITAWGYWKIVSKEEEADFVLKLNVRYAIDAYSDAKFINPNTNAVVYITKEASSVGSPDFNSKRAAVQNLIMNKIKPIFIPIY